MEDEKFISGYCRQLDCSRMVTVELTDGVIEEVDCLYGSCIYEPNCQLAKAIDALKKELSQN